MFQGRVSSQVAETEQTARDASTGADGERPGSWWSVDTLQPSSLVTPFGAYQLLCDGSVS